MVFLCLLSVSEGPEFGTYRDFSDSSLKLPRAQAYKALRTRQRLEPD